MKLWVLITFLIISFFSNALAIVDDAKASEEQKAVKLRELIYAAAETVKELHSNDEFVFETKGSVPVFRAVTDNLEDLCGDLDKIEDGNEQMLLEDYAVRLKLLMAYSYLEDLQAYEAIIIPGDDAVVIYGNVIKGLKDAYAIADSVPVYEKSETGKIKIDPMEVEARKLLFLAKINMITLIRLKGGVFKTREGKESYREAMRALNHVCYNANQDLSLELLGNDGTNKPIVFVEKSFSELPLKFIKEGSLETFEEVKGFIVKVLDITAEAKIDSIQIR